MHTIPKDIERYLQKRGIWGHIYVPVPESVKQKQARNEQVRQMAGDGVSKTTIAERLHISRQTVYNVLNEKSTNE